MKRRGVFALTVREAGDTSQDKPVLQVGCPVDLEQTLGDFIFSMMAKKFPRRSFDVHRDVATVETGGGCDIEGFLDEPIAMLDELPGENTREICVVLKRSTRDDRDCDDTLLEEIALLQKSGGGASVAGGRSIGATRAPAAPKRAGKRNAPESSTKKCDKKRKKKAAAKKNHSAGDEDAGVADLRYSQTPEGGNKFIVKVVDHSYIGGGKFLVEWYLKGRPAEDESTPLSSSRPLFTTWVKYDEFIVPTAALDYIDSNRVKNHPPDWSKQELRENVVKFKQQLSRDTKEIALREEEDEAAAELCFCCFLCQCGMRGKARAVQMCETGIKLHRACCHKLTDSDKMETFCSKAGKAFLDFKLTVTAESDESEMSDGDSAASSASSLDENEKKRRRYKRVMQQSLDSGVRSARSRETRITNDAQLAAPDSARYSDPIAAHIQNDFREICKQRKDPELKRRANVLSLFSGIGGAEVALKKLGIDIRRVVSVDHDRVAQHVYRHNHDPAYGGAASDDGIEYIFLCETYEELEKNVKNVVRRYGPFDVVIGGPPCLEYSKVNAYRQGAEGRTGCYMRDFPQLIAKIKKLNVEYHDGFKELFFMVENVPGAEWATQDFHFSEYCFDAATFGPCARNRLFYFNWAPPKFPEVENAAGGTSCFADGWMMPSKFKRDIDCKVGTLLASKARTMEDKLYKWKIREGMANEAKMRRERGEDLPASLGESELVDTNDRERLMGLPVDYVAKPVKDLFCELKKAYMVGTKEGNKQWRDVTSPKFWNFLNLGPDGYSFTIEKNPESGKPQISLAIKAINQSNQRPVRLKDYEYAWHLIGNGFSIPQVKYLLAPLKDVFQSRQYPGYSDRPFAWPDDNTEDTALEEHVHQGSRGALGPVKQEVDSTDTEPEPGASSIDEGGGTFV